jgi:hypothetical protein
LAVPSALWLSLNGLRWSLFSVPSNPLFESRLPPEYYPAKPSRPAAASQPLSWALAPYSTSRIKGPLAAGIPARYVPPSGFGYPLDGLLPSIPVPVFFRTGGAHGIHPSELSPRGRYSERFRPKGPTYCFAGRCSRRRSGGPAQQAAVPGLRPFRESLATAGLLTRQPLDAPLGFTLPGFYSGNLARAFTRSPLTRFTSPAINRQTRRRPRVSIGRRLPPTTRRAEAQPTAGRTLLGFSHRPNPSHSRDRPSGLCVHLSPRWPSLAAYDDPWMGHLALPELLGLSRGAEHSRRLPLACPKTCQFTDRGVLSSGCNNPVQAYPRFGQAHLSFASITTICTSLS